MTPATRAVLFDFGGTLYDYRCFARAEAESFAALAEWCGIGGEPDALLRAHRAAMPRVFRDYLPRAFYLHRDLFRDAVIAALGDLGATATPGHLERYRALQWSLHRRDLVLRPGVVDTLARLRRHGLAVGIVSNIDEDQVAHLLDAAALRPHVDWALSSEQAGACKPDGRIFATALARAGCAPAEALFVGDSVEADVAGANAAGLRSVLLWHRDDRPPPDGPVRPHHLVRTIPELLVLAGPHPLPPASRRGTHAP
jgi:putative hydrolase of the HAD superfamily